MSALGVLRRFSSSLEPVLLSFLHARIAREEAGLSKRESVGLGVYLEERPEGRVLTLPVDAGYGVVAEPLANVM